MPTKNRERDDLNTYEVHFVDKSSEKFHTPDKLINSIKGDHPYLKGSGDEFMINLDNVTYIENVTPAKPVGDK